jgi:hypothetical protein
MNSMKRCVSVIVMTFGGAGLSALACTSQNDAPPETPSSGYDGAPDAAPAAPDASDSDASDDASVTLPQALLRIAHLSPDLPAIDVCVAPHGTTAFQGPLIRQLALAQGADPDAGMPGFSYAQVTAYLSLNAGSYDVRVVSGGAASCDLIPHIRSLGGSDGGDAGEEDADAPDTGTGADAPDTGTGADAPDTGTGADAPDTGALDASDASDDAAGDASIPAEAGLDSGPVARPFPSLQDVTTLSALLFDTSSTLLIAGAVSPAAGEAPLTFTLLPDDEVLVSGAAVLRAINAMPGEPALDFGFSSPAAWVPLFSDVVFGAASAKAAAGEGAVDARGYLPIAPTEGQALSARPFGGDGGTDVATSSSLEVDLGGIATVIAIGGAAGDSTHPAGILLCSDNQPSGGLLSDCRVAP